MHKAICIILAYVLVGITGQVSTAVAQDSPTGFFVTLESQRRCENKRWNLDNSKSFCLPREPLIADSEFESVGDVVLDTAQNVRYFIIRLSVDGYMALKLMSDKLPDSELALVVQGNVVGVFSTKMKVVSRNFPVYSDAGLVDLKWIHSRIREVLANRRKKQ